MNKSAFVLSFLLVSGAADARDIDCAKLGPGKVVSRDFLLQFHDEPDGFLDYHMDKYDNLDVKGAAELIDHMLSHGISKDEIKQALRDCAASNVRLGSAPERTP